MQNPTIAQLEEAIEIRHEIDRLEDKFSKVFQVDSRADTGNHAEPSPTKKKRKMSAAGRAAISAAATRRWAKQRKEKKG